VKEDADNNDGEGDELQTWKISVEYLAAIQGR